MIDRAVTESGCPQCGARPGEKCRDMVTGRLAPGVLIHKARADAWKASHR